jgi:hypothetical protein
LYASAFIANNDKHTVFATLKAVHDRQFHFNGIGCGDGPAVDPIVKGAAIVVVSH